MALACPLKGSSENPSMLIWLAESLWEVKPLFTEIEKNNCFSVYKRSDLNKIREETIEKCDLIDRSSHAKV